MTISATRRGNYTFVISSRFASRFAVMSQPTIADRVRSSLALRRLTQEQAGEAIGLTQKAMSRRLTGEVEFSASEVQKLAAVLHVPVSSFYGEVSA